MQKLVNVFTRTMRYINSLTVDEIMAKVDPGYYAPDINNDFWAGYKKGKIEEIRLAYPIFKRGDYSIPPSAVKLVYDTVLKTQFDDSDERAKYRRAAAQSGKIKLEDTYENRFVKEAMGQMPLPRRIDGDAHFDHNWLGGRVHGGFPGSSQQEEAPWKKAEQALPPTRWDALE